MSVTAYEYLSVLRAAIPAPEDSPESEGINYVKVLEQVRSEIAARHSEELSAALGNPAARALKTLIQKYSVEALAGREYDQAVLVKKIYQDMAGLGVLTEYLYDPEVEEVNINGFDLIEICYFDHISYLYGSEASPRDRRLWISSRLGPDGGKL
jgi:pilus assembly protein CpaF